MSEKAIVIIGMGPGNGRAIAEKFGSEGYSLGLISRSADKLAAQAAELEARGYTVAYHAADTSDLDGLEAVISGLEKTLGAVDTLAFNAYATSAELPAELVPAQLAQDLKVNAAAPLAAAHAVLPTMRERGTGAIIFTGGGLALYPSMHAASLSVGKAAIRSLAFVLNEELKSEGIRAGTVTIAANVGTDITADEVAEAFWTLSQDRSGDMPAETILTPS